DFTYQKNKGIGWIDQIRLDMKKNWYTSRFKSSLLGLNKNIGVGVGIKKEKQMVIPALRKLIARSAVLEGYSMQYQLLESQKIKPSDFEEKLMNLSESSLVDGSLILEPTLTSHPKREKIQSDVLT
ncbi:MAG: hypothetical protein AAFY63_09635, partial [Cyanobacteria bacterium J06643_13]